MNNITFTKLPSQNKTIGIPGRRPEIEITVLLFFQLGYRLFGSNVLKLWVLNLSVLEETFLLVLNAFFLNLIILVDQIFFWYYKVEIVFDDSDFMSFEI